MTIQLLSLVLKSYYGSFTYFGWRSEKLRKVFLTFFQYTLYECNPGFVRYYRGSCNYLTLYLLADGLEDSYYIHIFRDFVLRIYVLQQFSASCHRVHQFNWHWFPFRSHKLKQTTLGRSHQIFLLPQQVQFPFFLFFCHSGAQSSAEDFVDVQTVNSVEYKTWV